MKQFKKKKKKLNLKCVPYIFSIFPLSLSSIYSKINQFYSRFVVVV